MEINIGLIDYGMGNLHSVEQFFKRKNQPLKRVKGPNDLNNCNALILPGVGSFSPAMINLKQTKLIPELKAITKNNSKEIIIEASGIDPKDIKEYASTGVDIISSSAPITQSKWIDLSMRFNVDEVN